MKNYRLIIQYDGTHYSGWQIQNNAVTVQQVLTDAVFTILKQKVNLIGSGRTDTGVHAFGQTANFRCVEDLDIYRFKYQMNSILPPDIAVVNMEIADVDFHARFDAKKRSYIYLFSRNKSPFINKYSWYVSHNLDIKLLKRISAGFLGQKNFTAFSKASSETKNKVCEVYSISWRETKGVIIFYIEADRFLHGMVRTIIGTILKAADNSYPEEYIRNIFLKNNRTAAGESVPPSGLFLYKVKYDN